MYSCLTLNDILSVIFEHFFVTADASTLAALARTCRTFTEPALDVLWRELYTLSPLLQCMSTDLWVLQKGIQSHQKELCLCKPLADADWSRVNYYKPRIRALGQSAFRFSTISWHAVCTQTLRELSFYQPTTSLLPNLHTLNFRILPIDAVPFARMLLGPRITEITVPIMSEDAEQSAELLSSLIPYISPDIVRLNVLSNTGITTPFSAIFQLIEGLHKLSDLHIDVKHRGLHERVAVQLGRLSSLSRLKISLIHSDQLRFYTTALSQYPVLTEFSFAVDDWTSGATIMDSMHCRFTNLAVVTHKQGSLSELRTFTESVSRHPSSLSLTHLSITNFETTCDTGGQSYVEDTFRKLFALSGLTSLILQIDVSSVLRDSWYIDAAAAWPLLVAVSVSSSDMGPHYIYPFQLHTIRKISMLSGASQST